MELNNRRAKQLKKDFPIFENNKGLVYLDNAATSQRPKQMINAVIDFYEKDNANISRGVHTLAERATERYEEARKVVADFVNADSKEIIFTRNTTESLNLLAYTLESIIPEDRDEILLTEMEHHSNLIPWQQLAKRKGMKLKFVKIKDDFTLDMEDLRRKLTSKTAILSITHISNVLGTINPINEIVQLGKKKGAITIIDAAQSVQHMKVDAKKIGCDFLAFSSHKMLGPNGIGVLYGRKELLEKMPPFNFGGGMISKVTFEVSEWAEIPEKFEAGTPNVAGSIGLAEAIKYLDKIGLDNIGAWEGELLNYALEKMRGVSGIKMFVGKNSGSIISFIMEGIHPHDVAQLLNEDKIAVRAGHNCAMPLMKVLGVQGVSRASFSFFNTFEDVDKLVEGLKKINLKFKK